MAKDKNGNEIPFITAYGPKLSPGISFDPNDPNANRTKQAYRDECDINKIMERYELVGELPNTLGSPTPSFGDFTTVVDYHTACNAVRNAETAFMTLPGALRARFANDPQNLLAFLADSSNREEAEELGLTEIREAANQKKSAAAPQQTLNKTRGKKPQTDSAPLDVTVRTDTEGSVQD